MSDMTKDTFVGAFLREFAKQIPDVDLRNAVDCADAAFEDGGDPVDAAKAEADEWKRAT